MLLAAPGLLCVSVVVLGGVVCAAPEGLLLTAPGLLALGGVVWVCVALPATPPLVLGELLAGGMELGCVLELGGVCCVCSLGLAV